MDSDILGSSETDIVDPLNAFTEFWELVEDNEVDENQGFELDLSEEDNQASKSVGQPNVIEENERAGHSQPQTDHISNSWSNSPSIPRRSSRSTRGIKPKRYRFTLNPFTAKWI